jgi:NAD(P)-dependent dehydrogenase (short-subunit alcohol dehydrogenase family)
MTAESTILVTGANRGVGRALVDEALRRGAGRVYAATRAPFAHPDERVTNLILDVTDPAAIAAAAARTGRLDLLINNAGVAAYDDLGDRAVLERQLEVNLFGTLAVTRAFLPGLLEGAPGSAIVNILSTASLAAVPVIPSYSISKAAAFSLTQSLRAHLAGRGVSVHGVILGPTDTDMSRGVDFPKAGAAEVAAGVFDGVEKGEEDIFPDPASREQFARGWVDGPVKGLEHAMAGFLPESRATAG